MDSIIGFISGILLSSAFWILGYRSSWRNYFTRELKVDLSFKNGLSEGGQFQSVEVTIDIICTNDENIKITDLYFKLPKNIYGRRLDGRNILGRQYVDYTWHFNDEDVFHLTRTIDYKINDQLLQYINARELKMFRVVVCTNRYGKTISNCLSLKSQLRHLDNLV